MQLFRDDMEEVEVDEGGISVVCGELLSVIILAAFSMRFSVRSDGSAFRHLFVM